MPTPVWISGWEHGRAPAAADGTPSLGLGPVVIVGEDPAKILCDATAARTGSYGLHIINDATTGAALEYALGPTGQTQLVVCFYFKLINSLPVNRVDIFVPAMAGGSAIKLRFDNTTGKIDLVPPSGTIRASTMTISLNTWYRVELSYDFSTGTQTCDWQIAVGDAAATVQTQCTYTTAADTCRHFDLGNTELEVTDLCIDDMVVSFTTADYPIGPVAIHGFTIDQTAAAEHQSITTSEWQYTDDWSGFTNFASQTETDSRSRLDDLVTPGDGIRMNAATTVAGNARWKLAKPGAYTSQPILAVQALFSGRESAAGTSNAVVRALLAGNTTDIFASADPGWGTTWNFPRACMALAPGGAAWQAADIDALRFEVDSTDATPNIWIGGTIFEVAVTPTTASSGAPSADFFLQEDGSSNFLLEDGTGKLLQEPITVGTAIRITGAAATVDIAGGRPTQSKTQAVNRAGNY